MSAPPKQQTIPASTPHIPISALEPSVCPQGRQPVRQELGARIGSRALYPLWLLPRYLDLHRAPPHTHVNVHNFGAFPHNTGSTVATFYFDLDSLSEALVPTFFAEGVGRKVPETHPDISFLCMPPSLPVSASLDP